MRHLVLITALAFVGVLATAGQQVQADAFRVGDASGTAGWQAESNLNQDMARHNMGHNMESGQDRADSSTLQLDRNQVRVVQKALNDRGYNSGPVDGIIGPKTRAAIRAYQEIEGLAVTGLPNQETLLGLAPATTRETQEHFGLSPAFGDDEFELEGTAGERFENIQFQPEDDMR